MYSTELVLTKESLETATTNPSIKEYKMGGMSICMTVELLAWSLTTLSRAEVLSMVMLFIITNSSHKFVPNHSARDIEMDITRRVLHMELQVVLSMRASLTSLRFSRAMVF